MEALVVRVMGMSAVGSALSQQQHQQPSSSSNNNSNHSTVPTSAHTASVHSGMHHHAGERSSALEATNAQDNGGSPRPVVRSNVVRFTPEKAALLRKRTFEQDAAHEMYHSGVADKLANRGFDSSS
eukprot:jgi/Chlat1/5842/Chrsp4S06228